MSLFFGSLRVSLRKKSVGIKIPRMIGRFRRVKVIGRLRLVRVIGKWIHFIV